MEIDPGHPARATHRRPTIGVLVGWQVYSGAFDSFLDRVFHGILAAAAERDCNLMLACGTGVPYGVGFGKAAWPLTSPLVDFVPVGPWNCDGLIVLPPIGIPGQAEYVTELIHNHYPVVCSVEFNVGTIVSVDNRSGVYQAIDHLIAHGHRRIAFISGRMGEIDGDSRVRLLAYQERLEHHGIAYDPNLVEIGYHNKFGGQQAMHALLGRKAKFTAMLGSNDESAVGAMQVLQAAGYLVPQDVAVIGFDDRIDARAQIPMLSSVHFPMFDVGYQALQTLLKQIDGSLTEPQKIMIPTRLVIRKSCGCLAGMNSENIPAGKPNLSAEPGLSINLGAPHPAKDGEPALDQQKTYKALTQTIITSVSSEEYHLGLREVDHLCRRLVEGLQTSLETGNPSIFLLTFQQILTRTSTQNDDLFTWHKVTTIMRSWLPRLIQAAGNAEGSTTPLTRQAADEMLIQARTMINEISQGQTARQTVWLENISNQLGEMSACFFTAQSENEIYTELIRRLPSVGILHAAIAYYARTEDDEYTWSDLQAASGGLDFCRRRFPSRYFPPDGLFPADRPFSVAVLPMNIEGVNSGYAVFDAGNLPVCATIVQQLTASIRGIHLYSQAVEARQIAETGKRMAEEANRMKNRFLSWVIHELRTPLNLIYGLSDMLLQENSSPQSGKVTVEREDLERIHIGSEHLVNLIRDVLDLASSEIGQLKLVRETLDLNIELRATAAIGSQLARSKHLILRTEIDEKLPAVFADRTRIRQIILNLINNSVKFTNQGEIILRANAVGRVVMITIQDTGLGIPPGEQSRIFEEFQQSERTSARGFGGLGLGLAICKRLVEMHGGEIGVQSSGEEGKGSTFYFTLPSVNALPEALVPPTLQSTLRENFTAQKLLLLVNDSLDGKEIKSQLDQRGYETQVYLVREENDWLAKVLLEQPQAVVLDLGLASRLGWEILKILKENPATQELPVMFCALEEEEDSGALLELDYITKPMGSAELAASCFRAVLPKAETRRRRKKRS